jgi:hypothetical protein
MIKKLSGLEYSQYNFREACKKGDAANLFTYDYFIIEFRFMNLQRCPYHHGEKLGTKANRKKYLMVLLCYLPTQFHISNFFRGVCIMRKNHLWFTFLLSLMCATMIIVVSKDSSAADPEDLALAFNPENYTTLNITVNGAPVQLRQYKVIYVAKPIKMASSQPNYGPNGYMGDVTLDDVYGYQTMYILVPERSYKNTTTAIFFMVGNGGWRTTAASSRITDGAALVSTGTTDNIGAALKAGYIGVSAGTRSRGARAADGSWAGKASAVVVDAKAAIRYLRLNDSLMPGSAERIIITGGSGGGGLSVAVAASGNSPDYYPYLNEIGAAGIDDSGRSTIRDDIFATVAYCPITDLGNADIA